MEFLSRKFIEGDHLWGKESPDKIVLWLPTQYINTDVALEFTEKWFLNIHLNKGITRIAFNAEMLHPGTTLLSPVILGILFLFQKGLFKEVLNRDIRVCTQTLKSSMAFQLLTGHIIWSNQWYTNILFYWMKGIVNRYFGISCVEIAFDFQEQPICYFEPSSFIIFQSKDGSITIYSTDYSTRYHRDGSLKERQLSFLKSYSRGGKLGLNKLLQRIEFSFNVKYKRYITISDLDQTFDAFLSSKEAIIAKNLRKVVPAGSIRFSPTIGVESESFSRIVSMAGLY